MTSRKLLKVNGTPESHPTAWRLIIDHFLYENGHLWSMLRTGVNRCLNNEDFVAYVVIEFWNFEKDFWSVLDSSSKVLFGPKIRQKFDFPLFAPNSNQNLSKVFWDSIFFVLTKFSNFSCQTTDWWNGRWFQNKNKSFLCL